MSNRKNTSRTQHGHPSGQPILIAHVDSKGAECKVEGIDRLKYPRDSFDVSIILDPANPIVTINGKTLRGEGSVHEIVRVAPVLYSEAVFKEVDALIAGHYGVIAATREVATIHGYSPTGFYRQYNDRHASKKRKYAVDNK